VKQHSALAGITLTDLGLAYLTAMRGPVTAHAEQKESIVDPLLVRSLLVRRGDSLNAWAIRHGWCRKYARMAVYGIRSGPKAQRIVAALRSELEV
jgi:hypothetical protein